MVNQNWRQHQKQTFTVDIVTVDGETDDIYNAFRWYCRERKLASFYQVGDDKGWNETQRMEKIVDNNNIWTSFHDFVQKLSVATEIGMAAWKSMSMEAKQPVIGEDQAECVLAG